VSSCSCSVSRLGGMDGGGISRVGVSRLQSVECSNPPVISPLEPPWQPPVMPPSSTLLLHPTAASEAARTRPPRASHLPEAKLPRSISPLPCNSFDAARDCPQDLPSSQRVPPVTARAPPRIALPAPVLAAPLCHPCPTGTLSAPLRRPHFTHPLTPVELYTALAPHGDSHTRPTHSHGD